MAGTRGRPLGDGNRSPHRHAPRCGKCPAHHHLGSRPGPRLGARLLGPRPGARDVEHRTDGPVVRGVRGARCHRLGNGSRERPLGLRFPTPDSRVEPVGLRPERRLLRRSPGVERRPAARRADGGPPGLDARRRRPETGVGRGPHGRPDPVACARGGRAAIPRVGQERVQRLRLQRSGARGRGHRPTSTSNPRIVPARAASIAPLAAAPAAPLPAPTSAPAWPPGVDPG